jgi:TolA-binding protein
MPEKNHQSSRIVQTVKIKNRKQNGSAARVRQLRGEIEELQRRIKEAEGEQNKQLVRELTRKKEYIQALLETFRKYAERL